ncbi:MULTISPECIES: formate dehydrogenase [Ramlibacter]|jgi:uncharacterized phage protein gp47/JayE|uniref:Formate dehydrogenase n=1 Tax=Ramlibacter pinisoli TaxID=2682844 RepID=A0A6N8IUJ4_9BURK|nr:MULTISPECIES: formate dehydrogenase [Ramlibacter]MBA2964711.1 formate dehydrogenase [Ramlibacter sp. CGMCC 1.13660]MVQ29676.1 formate dehydrogenase [Ramlibacter pinisoli]
MSRPANTGAPVVPSSDSKLSRRTLFAGAGTVGALAAAVSLVPGAQEAVESASVPAKPAPERGGGYVLSEHVKRYYKTTRL